MSTRNDAGNRGSRGGWVNSHSDKERGNLEVSCAAVSPPTQMTGAPTPSPSLRGRPRLHTVALLHSDGLTVTRGRDQTRKTPRERIAMRRQAGLLAFVVALLVPLAASAATTRESFDVTGSVFPCPTHTYTVTSGVIN